MEEIVNSVFGSYAGLVLSLMGVCAAVAALLPAPGEDAGTFYRVLYKVLNLLAVNVGKARNADDVQQAPADQAPADQAPADQAPADQASQGKDA